jgi:hypothetical protein
VPPIPETFRKDKKGKQDRKDQKDQKGEKEQKAARLGPFLTTWGSIGRLA